MPCLPPSGAPLPLFGREATRRIEQRAQATVPHFTLMGRAGAAVARLALAVAPHARRIWVAAGPGNNGGDGLEAATLLRQAGLNVTVTLLAAPEALPADAARAWQRAVDSGVSVSDEFPAPLGAGDLIIDAVFGVGVTREPAGPSAALVRFIAAQAAPVLAVDLPSGLDGDTGQPFGALCVHARHTLSLLTLKPGLFTGAGRDHAGRVWFDDLGTSPGDESPQAELPVPPRPAALRHAQHKGSFGDVLVVGGSAGMAGAAILAARAAHAAGAGRVLVDLLDPAGLTHDPVRPELMLRAGARLGDLPEQATVVAGCGGGDAIAAALPRLLGMAPRLVLDADALNAIAADSTLQALLAARASSGREAVLTPHPLEAARLLGSSAAAVQADRLSAARALVDRFGAVVVLKGSGSVVAAPARPPLINPTGNAALATAGTGDVLAGWVGGLWSASGTGALEAARAGTWTHGEAADNACHAPLRAADLIEAMHAAAARARPLD
ncbi:MAG: NAD(P)H-hydrate dehydratase [Rhizobacter sp.]